MCHLRPKVKSKPALSKNNGNPTQKEHIRRVNREGVRSIDKRCIEKKKLQKKPSGDIRVYRNMWNHAKNRCKIPKFSKP